MEAIKVLLVEDNEGDIMLTLEALKEGQIPKVTEVLRDGWEAIRYIEQWGKDIDVKTPDLIVLDVNLPKVDGYEVLEKLKSDELTSDIPVVMLTTSLSEDDIIKSYQYKADHYIAKPLDADDFFRVVTSLEDFWLSHNNNNK